MEEVIELIGIIEGINYDGIINELEVDKLNEWLKRNQSLRYHGTYVHIISKINEILEDNYISEEEKQYLIDFTKDILSKAKGVSESIIVLNGIIEGIVCDKVINDQEINCLNAWLNRNIYLSGIRDYDEINSIVKDILKDNIITTNERLRLLDLLSITISDSKSNLKIEYLKKMVLNHKNIGISLIELIDNDLIIRKIHENAQRQLSKVLNSYSGTVIDNEMVFISLVLIGLLSYDGSYYPNVEETYSALYDKFSTQKIEGQIRSIINRFKTEQILDQSRIINTVLINAIVPKYYLPDFFEFIFDIYKLNFDYVLDKNIYDEFDFIYEGIKDLLKPDTDELQFNTTKKAYKLIQSTKQLILYKNNFESIIQLSISVIKLIDKIYWEEKEFEILNPYLKYGYENWIKRYYNNKVQKKEIGQCKNSIRSRWKPSLELHGKDIYLIPPIHRIKASYDYHSIKIVVENDNEVIYENESPYIQDIFGGYQINSQKILVDHPLSKLSYKVYAEGQIFYDSHKDLYRDVIVFDNDGKEISNHTDYEGNAVFCFNQNIGDIETFSKSIYYQLGNKLVNMDTVLMFGKTVFSFVSVMSSGIVGKVYSNTYIRNCYFEIPVYESIEYFVFESECSSSSLNIYINQNKRDLADLAFNVVERGACLKYIVKLPELKNGIYSIKITNSNCDDAVIADFMVALDSEFSYTHTKLDDENYNVCLNSDFIKESVSKHLYIGDFSNFNLNFFYNNTRFSYQVPLKIPMYQLDDLKWQPLINSLWVDDLNHDSQITFYGIDCPENEIRLINGNSLLETVQIKKEGNYYKIPIGFIKKYKTNYDYVNLIWLNSLKQMTGIKCLNVCSLNEEYTIIDYDPVHQTLNININFEGKGNVCISVIKVDDTVCFCKDHLSNDQGIVIENIKSFEKYKIVFFEKTKGFTLNKDRIMKQYDKEFYSYSGLIGKSFKIGNVFYDQYIKKEFVRKNYTLRNTYIRFDALDDNYKFIGNLYKRNIENNVFHIYKVNPVEIEITGDINSRFCEIAITKDQDGLLLDFRKHTICNFLDDPKATDIFSYIIDLKERDKHD